VYSTQPHIPALAIEWSEAIGSMDQSLTCYTLHEHSTYKLSPLPSSSPNDEDDAIHLA